MGFQLIKQPGEPNILIKTESIQAISGPLYRIYALPVRKWWQSGKYRLVDMEEKYIYDIGDIEPILAQYWDQKQWSTVLRARWRITLDSKKIHDFNFRYEVKDYKKITDLLLDVTRDYRQMQEQIKKLIGVNTDELAIT